MNTQTLKALFCYWITEREIIRKAKEAKQPKPWTDDPIFQQYRFCNVRRMDDGVSQWLFWEWYYPHHDHPNMLLAVCLARFFNWPETLAEIGFPEDWDPAELMAKLHARKARGDKIFNAAYMVRGNDGPDKLVSVIDYTIQPLVDNPPILNTSSMEKSHAAIHSRYGFGSFTAGQVVADLRWAMKGTWKDAKTWAPVGPGSKRGLNILLGRAIEHPISQGEFLGSLRNLITDCTRRLPASMTRRMEAMDWQNCLCEYSKYAKALEGSGRPKHNYPGAR